MKRGAFVLSSALLLAGAARDQHEHHGAAHRTAAVKLEVKTDAAARLLVLRLGPVSLPARTSHTGMAQPRDLIWRVPIDGWFVAYHPRLVDDAGQGLPGRLLHHVAFWNTGRSDFLCPNKEEHLFGAGGEMNAWPELPGFGYRVAKGERIRIETMFHNPTDADYLQAYLEVRVDYRPSDARSAIRSVYPAWFDVMECHDSGYDLPPGKSVTAGEIELRYSGTLLGVGGHLHDHGQRLVLENRTCNETIAELTAQRDAQGRILAMPIENFTSRGGYGLAQGERLRVTSTYENTTGRTLPEGAMGIVVGYFVPQNPAQMAALRRRHN